ncbi:MAG: esterase YqiA [Gammaproteobacteria bacterium]|nr:esterase YqiA [Gammaproteobacteria bacterium]
MPALIYIHGFNSSAGSHKAMLLRERMRLHGIENTLSVPQLPADPHESVRRLEQEITDLDCDTVSLMGSSLGGYYATWLAEKYSLRAVLINPAVYPYTLLNEYQGENTNPYTGEAFFIDESYIETLKSLDIASLSHPENFRVLLEKGDKVLNYREAADKFCQSHVKIFDGGSHEFVNFECQIDDMLVYCGYSI